MFPLGTTPEILGLVLAVVLTCIVFSRLLGDSGVYRAIQGLFVGVTSGYIVSIVWRSALVPRALLLIQQPLHYWYYGVFFILGMMLLGRGLRATSIVANLPLGILFGIGAALVLGGALAGTMIPLTNSLIIPLTPSMIADGWPAWAFILNAILIIAGTIAVLGVFQVTIPLKSPKSLIRVWSALSRTLGQGIIMITLGALYAGAFVSFFTLLVGRLAFLASAVSEVINWVGKK